jgi:ABC-type branched-subunit amino acid transport system substrate-binding protein
VTVRALDDEADPFVAMELVDSLEAAGVAGVVGFLQDDVLVSAAQARTGGLPIVSPTARTAQQAGEGVYSLEGADPLAAARIGRYAASRGIQRDALIHPSTPEAYEEAEAFSATVTPLGLPIVGTYTYPAGATHFEAQLEAARDALRAAEIAALGLGPDDTLRVEMLEPVGIFMPIPAEDVPFVAPQFAHFGLDTLAIEVIGTSGWTDPQALAEVDRRLVTGIVATAPVGGRPGSVGHERFREAYESHFQRSLVSPAPALGYDAALLLLEALRPGRIRPPDVQRAFEELTEIEGATGRYVVLEGRVLKVTEVVLIQGAALVPIPEG